jgi:hypothetical protein
MAAAANEYGQALADQALYREVWDPRLRLGRSSMPTLWLSWTGDTHFPLDQQAACYQAASGPRMVSLIPEMGHSHPSAWTPGDSYAFADSITRDGRPWCVQTGITIIGTVVRVTFSSTKTIDTALISSSGDSGATGERDWKDTPAILQQAGTDITVEAEIPAGSNSWFILLKSGDLHACSDYQGAGTAR